MNTQTNADAQNAAASNLLSTLVPFVGRGMISAIFLLSGLSKIAAPAMTIGYIQSVGLPLPNIAFGMSVFVELAGGLALLLGYRTRAVAGVLALFSLATAAVFHNALGDQNQFIHFFKNIAMAGGLLHVVAFGGGSLSLDARRG
ncbi:MAG: DoxX family protein [Alphaproteobacteria bacterium]|nr:DoxX family protein [Alphaproteobacteria bacterium]MBU1516566.1 DoxX family protein [Alphaproteobacteria bacterium]MBU2094323.1 DoxX family protein [Alphaproteobacteria bacterium]MBU2154100.1 DoxX family protein [Alphaproteobacteria bacterium]MBU2307493.1 DoxX family protein [Alphaproteobacteria bacterium]